LWRGFPLWESGTSTSLKTGSHRSKSCGAVFPYGMEAVALTGLIHVAGFPYGKVVLVPVSKSGPFRQKQIVLQVRSRTLLLPQGTTDDWELNIQSHTSHMTAG